MLAGWIRLKENNSAREQLFPLRVKNIDLALDDLFKQIIAMLFGAASWRRRIRLATRVPSAGTSAARFLPGSSAKNWNFTDATSPTLLR
jgi:hypothetical protein